jgi:hypothetical protein
LIVFNLAETFKTSIFLISACHRNRKIRKYFEKMKDYAWLEGRKNKVTGRDVL